MEFQIKELIISYNLVLIYSTMVPMYNIVLAESRIRQLEDDYCMVEKLDFNSGDD